LITKCIIHKRGKALPIGILKIALVLIIISNSILFYTPVDALFHKENDRSLPVLMIHGYLLDASVWNKWKDFLKKDGIQFQAVTFKQSDDKCGTAIDHAKELHKIVQDLKKQTGAQQINIVGHSKGGLDARVYLANT
jgi:triacylglycerol esterase/lipase EstA (alpha/beta hydrolase family)